MIGRRRILSGFQIKVVFLMATRTQRNIVRRVTRIHSVLVSPLYGFLSSAENTFHWFAFDSSEPVMKSSVSYLLTLPSIVVFPTAHNIWVRLRCGGMSLRETIFLTSFLDSFGSFLTGSFKRTLTRTVMVFGPVIPGRGGSISGTTLFTGCLHKNILAQMQI